MLNKHFQKTAIVGFITRLKMTNDLVFTLDSGENAVLVVLPDLSTALVTVNHDILLHVLNVVVGIMGTALQWFNSFFSISSTVFSASAPVFMVSLRGTFWDQCAFVCIFFHLGTLLRDISPFTSMQMIISLFSTKNE